jgi:hypothetical protein
MKQAEISAKAKARRDLVFDLRLYGCTFPEIGRYVGISPKRAWHLYSYMAAALWLDAFSRKHAGSQRMRHAKCRSAQNVAWTVARNVLATDFMEITKIK